MDNFFFYTSLGLKHVLDVNAYDHVLFLAALAIPFSFKDWRKVVILVSVFTISHCLSLGFSVLGLLNFNVRIIEFLIPVTILITASTNLFQAWRQQRQGYYYLLVISTFIFGLIHGLGFSNYFKMLMSGEEEILTPLIGFALGIEIAQLIVILVVLCISYILDTVLGISHRPRIIGSLVALIIMTLPLLFSTWPL